jgi:hypothetical protein
MFYLPPTGGRVVVSDDEGVVVVLPGLLISGLVHSQAPGGKLKQSAIPFGFRPLYDIERRSPNFFGLLAVNL